MFSVGCQVRSGGSPCPRLRLGRTLAHTGTPMPGGIHIAPSGTKPQDPEKQHDVRGDPHTELREAIGFIFEGLTEEEIEDRLTFYSLPSGQNPTIGLDAILSDKGPPLPAEEKVFRLIVPMLQGMLRAECKRQEKKDGSGNREAIADLADSIIEKLLDAARGGRTWGEQHARVLDRHPFAFSDACSLPNDSPLTVKKAKDRMRPLRAFEVVREIEDLKLEFEKILPSTKSARKRQQNELRTNLKERYPELGSFIRHSANIEDLTPDKAARIVWGRRQTPVMGEKTVSNLLGDMNDRILIRTSRSEWLKKHPEAYETSTTKEHS